MNNDNKKNIDNSEIGATAAKRKQAGERDISASLASGAELLAKKHLLTGEKVNTAAPKSKQAKGEKLKDTMAANATDEKAETNKPGITQKENPVTEKKEEIPDEKTEPGNGENAEPKKQDIGKQTNTVVEQQADVLPGSGVNSIQAVTSKEKPAKSGSLKTDSLAKITTLYRHLVNIVNPDGEKPGKQSSAEKPAAAQTITQTHPVQIPDSINESERIDNRVPSGAEAAAESVTTLSETNIPQDSQTPTTPAPAAPPPKAASPDFTAPQTKPAYQSAASTTAQGYAKTTPVIEPGRRSDKSIAYIVFVCLVAVMFIAASVSMLRPNKISGAADNPEEPPESMQTEENGAKGVFIRENGGITYLTIDGCEMIVVNKEFSVPSDYGSGVVPEAKQAFDSMMAAAQSNGLTLYLTSDFLDYKTQQILFDRYTKFYGEDKTRAYMAEPGHSEHQLGLAFDVYGPDTDYMLSLDFKDTAEYIWLAGHGAEYGFIVRYPEGKSFQTGYEFEPWHFRYVGVELAKIITESGMAVEEYIAQAQMAE